MSTYNFQIDLQCPGCGAPVVLEETQCIIECPFCRTRNILQALPYPCYTMGAEPKRDLELVYIPYWRFKGLEFSLGGQAPGFRVVDHSFLAVDKIDLPLSLGLRSQTRKLHFVRKDTPGSFLKPSVSQKDILSRIVQEKGKDKKIHIGEILSLIFMPFYRDGDTLYDGLTGKAMVTDPLELLIDKGPPTSRLKFIPALCPNCGWDLEGNVDSLVLRCSNCISFHLIHHHKLNRLTVTALDSPSPTDLQLPFWRLQVEFKTLACSTQAHLIKMANMPRAITQAHEQQPLYFYVPAFKINPKLFLRVARQTTLAQPEPSGIKTVPDKRFHPVDLPLEEGFQAILPLVMDLCVRKQEIWDVLEKERLKLTSASLTYIPFKTLGSEVAQETLGFSLPKNSLKFGRQL